MSRHPRICPVPDCGRTLGTTRHGDPFALCGGHYHRLSRTQQQRLWQAWKAWQRLERQRLRSRAETGEVTAGLLAAIAESVKGYLVVRDDCIASFGPRQGLEVAL